MLLDFATLRELSCKNDSIVTHFEETGAGRAGNSQGSRGIQTKGVPQPGGGEGLQVLI